MQVLFLISCFLTFVFLPYSALYLVPTKATYVVTENQKQAMVCFLAAPIAALRVNVTIVAMEDDVPSARCMAEM